MGSPFLNTSSNSSCGLRTLLTRPVASLQIHPTVHWLRDSAAMTGGPPLNPAVGVPRVGRGIDRSSGRAGAVSPERLLWAPSVLPIL